MAIGQTLTTSAERGGADLVALSKYSLSAAIVFEVNDNCHPVESPSPLSNLAHP